VTSTYPLFVIDIAGQIIIIINVSFLNFQKQIHPIIVQLYTAPYEYNIQDKNNFSLILHYEERFIITLFITLKKILNFNIKVISG